MFTKKRNSRSSGPSTGLIEAYRSYYAKLSETDKRRYWVMLGQGARDEFVRIESYLGHLAANELEQRILWKPA